MPERIQRRRTKGWRMPPDAIYVGRPTFWGNDARAGDCAECRWGQHDGEHEPLTATDAIEQYRTLWEALTWAEGQVANPVDLFADIRGHDLACWCPLCELHADGRPADVACPDCPPCHADVLLELANA
jgi:hypothetical protein